jgi:hypothetical protein
MINKVTGQFLPMDLTGQTFNKLTAIRVSHKDGNGYWWVCSCDCGKETTAMATRLVHGKTKSCGCLKFSKQQNKTHGLRYHPLYGVWKGIKYRCFNPNAPHYPDYGGRGIKMCDRWKDSAENFYNDMISGYEKGLHIGRINNDGDYEPSNCRWETPILNNNNKRSNIYVTMDGRTHTPAEWARELVAKADTIRNRIRRGRKDYEALFGKRTVNEINKGGDS